MQEQFGSRLDDISLFVMIVRAGSLSRAAQLMKVSKSHVSTRLQRFEKRLATQLLQRTTRRMQLTEAGQALFARGNDIVQAAEEAERAVTRLSTQVVGRLRVSAPTSLGQEVLASTVARLLIEEPKLQIDLALADRDVDLVNEGFDMAVRVGDLGDTTLVQQVLARSRQRLVASPAFWRRHGKPRTGKDLARYPCLLHDHSRDDGHWRFLGARGEYAVEVRGPLRSNNGQALAQAACEGLGVARLPDFIVASHLRRGALVSALDRTALEPLPIRAVYPNRRHLSAKVTRFIEAARRDLTGAAAPTPASEPPSCPAGAGTARPKGSGS